MPLAHVSYSTQSEEVVIMPVLEHYSTAHQVFDGVMLSDGGLEVTTSRKARFNMALSGVSHLDWLDYVAGATTVLGAQVSPGYPKVWDRVSVCGTRYKYCFLRTLTCGFLTAQHPRWYAGGIKVVPLDVELTPAVVANWFMGDAACGRGHGITLEFTTESFDEDSLLVLERKLRALNIETGRCRRPNGGHRITVRTHSVPALVNMVEQYVLPSYRYKINALV